MYDAFGVSESGYIQAHEYVEKDLITYLKSKQLSQPGVLCSTISGYSIQAVISLAVNRYLEISAQAYAAGHSQETLVELENCVTALGKLYDALFPLDMDFAAFEMGQEDGIIPDWVVKHGKKAKRALDITTSNLSDISSIGGKTILGNYNMYRKSRVENAKNACNTFFYHLRNSIWNLRIGESVWTSMVGVAFNPKRWCKVVSNQVRNHDNTITETDDSFNPEDGFYFRNLLDSWQIQQMLDISELLGCRKLFSIAIGRRNCCGQENYLIYSSSNFNTPPLSVKAAEHDENTPEMYYLRSDGKAAEWSAIPR